MSPPTSPAPKVEPLSEAEIAGLYAYVAEQYPAGDADDEAVDNRRFWLSLLDEATASRVRVGQLEALVNRHLWPLLTSNLTLDLIEKCDPDLHRVLVETLAKGEAP